MGLFDHLFKPKAPAGEEKVVEHAAEASHAAKPAEGASRTPIPQRADPSAFLHPKSTVPRGAPSLTAAPLHAPVPAPSASSKTADRRHPPTGPAPAADDIVLTLGDVLSRIPTEYLRPGAHDAKRELRFKVHDLSSDIARGRAAVPLSRIAHLAPEIFAREITRHEDMEVRLPLQKLVEQIGLLRSRPKASGIEKIAHAALAAELPATAKKGFGEPIDVHSVAEPLRSVAPPPPSPPIILAEAATIPRSVELKPMAEQAAATPVILGPPPPVVETPAAPLPPPPPPIPMVPLAPLAPVAPVEPVAAVIAPAPVIPEAPQPIEPATAAVEPPPVVPVVLPAEPPVAPEPPPSVVEVQEDVAAKVEEREEPPAPAPEAEVEVELPPLAPAAEGQTLAPVESPDLDPGEEKIQLSLAAILRHCPPEIVVGKLPHVDDSVRITLPFAPIDRQLVKGHVEVSALRFIVALPQIYQKYFAAKVGIKVPIPLEEVFQNLPSSTHELTPMPPIPPPVVLAPAAHAVPTPEFMPADVAPHEKPAEHPVPPVSTEEAPAAATASAEAITVEPPSSPARAEDERPEAPAAPVEETRTKFSPIPWLKPEPPRVEFVPPPLPLVAEAAPSAAEPPPIPSVAASLSAEAPPAAEAEATPPATTPAEAAPTGAPSEPAPPPFSPGDASAPPSDDGPKITFRPPVFRPHFLPPPPIFRFTPAPATPETDSAVKSEPPSVLSGLVEPAGTVEPPAGTIILEASTPAVPAGEPPTAEAPVLAASDAEPSAELIASAGEHDAPDIVQFSDEPVPFADLAETLAHETTYASDLAEVVHVDFPETSPRETSAPVATEAPVAAEAPVPPSEEHRAVPMEEGLAAAAVAATIAEHAPLDFHEAAPMVEEPKEPKESRKPRKGRKSKASEASESPEETPEAIEVPAVVEGKIEEPAAAGEPAPASELAAAVVSEESAPVIEPPAAEAPAPAAPEPPAEPPAAVPPSLPHPLFPLPKPPSEPAHLEVFPPPALPLRRFDQDAVQALFMTEETLDLQKISRLAAGLPGVYACVIATRDQACTGGTLPEGFDLAALLGLAPRVGEAAGRMPIGNLKHFTLYGDAYSVSFFARHGLSLCAVHRPRSFVPGVREKLVALADELSR